MGIGNLATRVVIRGEKMTVADHMFPAALLTNMNALLSCNL